MTNTENEELRKALIEYAEWKANQIVLCFLKYRQAYPLCEQCLFRDFCSLIKDKLNELLQG